MRVDAVRNRARILDAAEEVFAERGGAASTEEVARRAGVAIGTVFRHFPTKDDLLVASMKRLAGHLADEAGSLVAAGDPATALFTFVTDLVEQVARRRTVVDLLGRAGGDVSVVDSVRAFESALGTLLANAQRVGAARRDVGTDEVIALLVALCHGVLGARTGDDALRGRTVALALDGLRPGRGVRRARNG